MNIKQEDIISAIDSIHDKLVLVENQEKFEMIRNYVIQLAKEVEGKKNETAAVDFLMRLTTEYGAIVSSSRCNAVEIALANACGRMLVLDSLGFVLRSMGPFPVEDDTCCNWRQVSLGQWLTSCRRLLPSFKVVGDTCECGKVSKLWEEGATNV